MSLLHAPGRFLAETLTWLRPPLQQSLLLMRLREIDCRPDPYFVVDAIRRHNLYLVRDYPATVPILTSALQISTRYRPDAMALVIIDDHRCTGPGVVHRELTELLRDRLADNGTDILAAWLILGTEPGSTWFSLLDKDHGTLPPLPDPLSATDDSAAAITADTTTAELVAAELARRPAGTLSDPPGSDTDCSQQRLRLVLGWIHHLHQGASVAVPALASIAEALQDSTVRDVLFAVAVGPHGEDAGPLWMLLARCLPAGQRALPAMLLAVTTYLSGRPEHAVTELRYALADTPNDPTLQAMARAVADRVPAEVLRTVALSGRVTAADLDIDIDID